MWRSSARVAVVGILLAGSLGGRAGAAGVSDEILGPGNAAKVKPTATLTGHKGAVFAVAFSPDGGRVASAGVDKGVRLWDAGTGAAGPVLAGHTNTVAGVAFTPDGAALHSAGYDPAVRVWAVPAGTAVEAQAKNPKDANQRLSVSNLNGTFGPGGGVYVGAGDLGFVLYVWDVKEKAARPIHFPAGTGIDAHFRRAAFSNDGAWLAVQADRENDKSSIELWDWKASKWGPSLKPPAKAFVAGEALAVSADGKRVASVDVHTSRILVWDVSSGEVVATLAGHVHDADEQTPVSGLAFGPDGRLLASVSYDKTLRLWDVAAGKEAASLALPGMGTTVAFSADGRRLAAAGLDGTVTLFGVPGS